MSGAVRTNRIARRLLEASSTQLRGGSERKTMRTTWRRLSVIAAAHVECEVRGSRISQPASGMRHVFYFCEISWRHFERVFDSCDGWRCPVDEQGFAPWVTAIHLPRSNASLDRPRWGPNCWTNARCTPQPPRFPTELHGVQTYPILREYDIKISTLYGGTHVL